MNVDLPALVGGAGAESPACSPGAAPTKRVTDARDHLFGNTVDASSGSEPWARVFALSLKIAQVVQNDHGSVVLSVEDARSFLGTAPPLPDKAKLLKVLDDAPATSVGIGVPEWT